MPRSRKTKTKTHGNTKALLYISKLKAMHNGKTLKELIKIGIIYRVPHNRIYNDGIGISIKINNDMADIY